ncbi:MAG TPA: purine-nucleoside phosphorylase [Longimicrobiales bacterium]|nr:purine-nucleoside phosphorylase [Longimicrobiales bacterium]
MQAAVLRSQLAAAVSHVRARSGVAPQLGLILGTGLGAVATAIDVAAALDCADIPHMPRSTVAAHEGRLLLGTLAGLPVAIMQGRYHCYEGYTLQQVTLPVRLLHALGARTLVLSGACGGLHPLWQAGDLALITDHINLLGDNPLVGENLDELGPRFPDMSHAYQARLQRLTEQTALRLGIPLRRGVYAAVAGPNLETRAEYRMLRFLGADMVGMSTVPEVIVARHMNMSVLAISVVTDLCLPDALEPTSIDTIIRMAAGAEPVLARLLMAVLPQLETTAMAGSAA